MPWWARVALLAGAISLLGQGERSTINPALRTPGSALATYWEALQLNDPDGIRSCSIETGVTMPYPGMLWAFPNTRGLWIQDLRYLPIDESDVVVGYAVHFRPYGSDEERRLVVSTELLRVKGEWRVARPMSEAGLLNGRPMPTRVDI